MDFFTNKHDWLYCDGVSLNELAKTFGTPLYVYSEESIRKKCGRFLKAFSSYPTKVCYAVKANDNLTLLRTIFQTGLGADVVSGGELERALKAGVSLDKLVFSGVGKTQFEIERAIELGIASINVESENELELIKKISETKKKKVSVSLRANPNIDVKTNPYIATGLYETKFGIADEAIEHASERIHGHPFVKLEGVACHIGSQITELGSFEQAANRIKEIAYRLKEKGFPIRRIDLGGGLGISYKPNESVPSIESYAEAIIKVFKSTDFELFLEPGRAIIGSAGGLLTRILFTKQNRKRHFTIVDAAMNDLIRPSLYDAYHEIVPVKSKSGDPVISDIVGPICETGDFLGLGRTLPSPESGELLFIKNAGAYGATMSSNYNTRGRCAEVMVLGDQVQLIRRRETLEEQWQQEM